MVRLKLISSVRLLLNIVVWLQVQVIVLLLRSISMQFGLWFQFFISQVVQRKLGILVSEISIVQYIDWVMVKLDCWSSVLSQEVRLQKLSRVKNYRFQMVRVWCWQVGDQSLVKVLKKFGWLCFCCGWCSGGGSLVRFSECIICVFMLCNIWFVCLCWLVCFSQCGDLGIRKWMVRMNIVGSVSIRKMLCQLVSGSRKQDRQLVVMKFSGQKLFISVMYLLWWLVGIIFDSSDWVMGNFIFMLIFSNIWQKVRLLRLLVVEYRQLVRFQSMMLVWNIGLCLKWLVSMFDRVVLIIMLKKFELVSSLVCVELSLNLVLIELSRKVIIVRFIELKKNVSVMIMKISW